MLSFTDVSLYVGTRLLLRGLNFTINAGQKVGVVGGNGTGKTSLLRLIMGELEADTGTVQLASMSTLAYVAQEVRAASTSAREYVLDGDRELRRLEARQADAERRDAGAELGELHARLDAIGAYSAPARASRILHGLGFSREQEDSPVDAFSGGWRMRLNLAQALICRSDILLLDEPTNHLDLDAVIWLESWLAEYRGTLLLVTHDREFLSPLADTIAAVGDGQVKLYRGNYETYERTRAEQLAHQQAAHAKQQREMAHMRAYVDRFRYKASKARQAQSRLKAMHRMELISAAHADSLFRFAFREPERLPEPLVSLEDAAVGYAGREVLSSLRFSLAPGDRIGLLGANGAGKSTLVRLLAGELQVSTGKFAAAQYLKVGYFAQHQLDQLSAGLSPLEHLRRLDPAASPQELRNFIGGFGFHGDQATSEVGHKSGGEKARLALALVLHARPNLLLLDEPTNHLDADMRFALSVALQDYAGAVILVSHDRHLLRVVSNEFWLVSAGRVSKFAGDLEDYAGWLRTRLASAPAQDGGPNPAVSSARIRRREAAERRRQLAPLRTELRRIEQQLTGLHAEHAGIMERLADPGLYADEQRGDLRQIVVEQGQVEQALGEAEEAWLACSEQLEQSDSGVP